MTNLLRRIFVSGLAAAAVLAGSPAIAAAQAEVPLADLLRATHVHGLVVDRGDPMRLLIATHHGLHAAALGSGQARRVSETTDDLMGFTPHPTDATVLYASGHPAGGGNLGFVASADGGKSWTSLSPGVGGPVDFHQMDVSKADPDVIYGVHGGLQVSRDGGRSWEQVGPAPEGLIDLAASAQAAGRLYAATQQGLLFSADGGASWTPGHAAGRPVSLVEVTADGTVFAFVIGSGLLRADEGSLGWETVSGSFADRYLLHLAIDADEPGRLFALTQNGELLASRDGGRSWSVLAQP